MNNWDNDAIQFPRLIAEAQAAGAFTPEVMVDLATSMDLEIEQVDDLITRATEAWDDIVKVTPAGPFPVIANLRLSEGELQEMHECIGVAIEMLDSQVKDLGIHGWPGFISADEWVVESLGALRRARELASIVITDTYPEEDK